MSQTKSKRLPLDYARSRLGLLWLIGSGLIILLLIYESYNGLYSKPEEIKKIWGWLLPLLIPTLSLIITVLGANALRPIEYRTKVRLDFYRIAFWLSTVYLLVIGWLLIVVISYSDNRPADIESSNLFLLPMQALVVSALSVVFFTQAQDE